MFYFIQYQICTASIYFLATIDRINVHTSETLFLLLCEANLTKKSRYNLDNLVFIERHHKKTCTDMVGLGGALNCQLSSKTGHVVTGHDCHCSYSITVCWSCWICY